MDAYNSPYEPVKYDDKDYEPKKYLNLVVVGHVDSGKSTLIGKLLHSLRVIDDRELHKT